jgi:hypothetical protein
MARSLSAEADRLYLPKPTVSSSKRIERTLAGPDTRLTGCSIPSFGMQAAL